MIPQRLSLLLVAIAVLLISGTPVSAGGGAADVPWSDGGQCIAPATPAVDMPALNGEAPIPKTDPLPCSCHYCADHKLQNCTISPGYTMLCLTYYQANCPS
jgi:hypothetical protein